MLKKTRSIYLIVLFLAMWATMAWLASKAWHSYQLMETVIERDTKIIELRRLIVYLDEVLTSSTALAAYTNDLQKYEKRYKKHAYIDSTVSDMAKIARPDIKKMINRRIHQINKRLEKTELKVFDLIRQGNTKKAKELVNSPNYQSNKQSFDELINKLDEELVEVKEDLKNKKQEQKKEATYSIVLCAVLFILSLLVGYNFLKAQKNMQEDVEKRVSKDRQRFQQMSHFAEDLGQGNYEVSLDTEDEDEDGNLTTALVNMRDKLKEVAEEDRKRNWATEGVNQISNILRGQEDMKKVGDDILSFLLDYIGANQGGLYMVEENENSNERQIHLLSYYAFEKKKYQEQDIKEGQGMVGEVVKEGKMTYLTEVPDDYVQITSGLGKANPRCIVIVPLIFNEKVEGVLEIASFTELEQYQLDFLQDIGESLASSLSASKVNSRTKKLLEESQNLTAEMRQKEEEMRQNMEELQATQEDAERREKDLEKELEKQKEEIRLANEQKAMYKALLKEHDIDIEGLDQS